MILLFQKSGHARFLAFNHDLPRSRFLLPDLDFTSAGLFCAFHGTTETTLAVDYMGWPLRFLGVGLIA